MDMRKIQAFKRYYPSIKNIYVRLLLDTDYTTKKTKDMNI